MTIDQIAAEAAGKIGELLFEAYPKYTTKDKVESIIKSAIEKALSSGATSRLACDTSTGGSPLSQLRATRASEK